MNNIAQKLKKTKPFSILDLAIILILVVACVVPIIIFSANTIEGDIVKISYGEQTYSYALDQNREVSLKDGRVIIKIEDGCVWVQSSDCSTKTCQNSGKISKSGQSIVCLPNGISIRIVGDEFDASTGGVR